MPSGSASATSFNERYKLWVECLDGTDRNAVFRQIASMIWDAAAYRVINDARHHAPESGTGGVELNGMAHRLLDKCFAQSQMLAVRRLTDGSGLVGKRGTYSLMGLLLDMREHAKLLTREHLCAAQGTPLDLAPVEARFWEFVRKKIQAGERAYSVPGDLMVDRMKARHEDISRMAGVNTASRNPSDQVSLKVLDALVQQLDVCNDVAVHVNKFVAHAATPESRAPYSADTMTLTLGHIWDAHEAICKVANFVDVYLLTGTSHGYLAVPQYDQFEFMDRPLAPPTVLPALRETWRDYDRLTQAWHNWGIPELEAMTKSAPSSTVSVDLGTGA